ncbi:MAG: hypothetical protein WC264_02395 [Candidatus Paceibacterota bacterium]|jgi:hypothetical protein
MKKNELLQSVKVIILGLVLSVGIAFVFSAGIGTGSVPPSNNVPGPINTGTLDQIKNGGLSVNAFLVAGDSFFNGLVTLGNFIGGGNKPLCVDNSGNITTVCPEAVPVVNPPVVALPTVTTSLVSAITQTTATSGGNVTSDGGAIVTVSGIVWNTSVDPSTSNNIGKTTDGWAIGGPWSSNLTGLSAGTIYFVRAYATNSVGTSYGGNIQFTTTAGSSTPTLPTVETVILAQTTINTYMTDPYPIFGVANITNTGGAPVTHYGLVHRGGTTAFPCSMTVNTPITLNQTNGYGGVTGGTAGSSDTNWPINQNISSPTVINSPRVVIGRIGASDGNPNNGSGNSTSGVCVRAYATNSVGTAYGNLLYFN